MENLIIAQTKQTPQIELILADKLLRICGESYPENAMDVFQPLIEKLEQFFAKPAQDLTVELRVEYQNTSSSKMMYEIIDKLCTYQDAGHNINLTWYYPEGDTDLLENCEIFLEDANFPYQILEED